MIKDLNILNEPLEESKQGLAYKPKDAEDKDGKPLFYIESYGCQMNFSDSEIVASIMSGEGYASTSDFTEADLILINTCSIRENAEQRVRHRLKDFKKVKEHNPTALVGMLGCMAERLKEELLDQEKLVDLVVGPDAYRELPALIKEIDPGQKAVNVLLSLEETYADINPVRLGGNGVSAFISIMRGCDNMCSFCVVPFTRGRERSRDPQSIVKEAQALVDQGYKEVTLLGQNVDSYLWFGGGPKKAFNKLTEEEQTTSVNFAGLLKMVAEVSPELRVRFSTSHPKDITDDVLHTMAAHENICNYIHLPVQSGSSRILEKMNRTYDREWYKMKVDRVREIIPDCGISSDVIAGFCTETEEDHQDTLSMMEYSGYDQSYMFIYSERPGTLAAKNYEDDVPEEVKKRRLQEIVDLQGKISAERYKADVGKTFKVLIEGTSKRSEEHLNGRNDQNKMMVFPHLLDSEGNLKYGPGDYVNVKVESSTSATLIGHIVE